MRLNVSKGSTSRNQQDSRKLSYLYYSWGWWSHVVDLIQTQLCCENLSFFCQHFDLSQVLPHFGSLCCRKCRWVLAEGSSHQHKHSYCQWEDDGNSSQCFKVCQLSRRWNVGGSGDINSYCISAGLTEERPSLIPLLACSCILGKGLRKRWADRQVQSILLEKARY